MPTQAATPTTDPSILPTDAATLPVLAATPTLGISGSALGPEVSFWAGDHPMPTTFIPNPDPIFPADTARVTVWVPYHNMLPGMRVRREWVRNNEAWLTIEDTWRGAQGDGITALVIENQHGALASGEYQLSMYLADVPQGAPQRFTIAAPADAPAPLIDLRGIGITEQDGERAAIVRDWGSILIEHPSGATTPVITANWITGMAWFPDGRHLVYVDRLPERSATDPTDAPSQLYVVNVSSGETTLIGRADEYFTTPEVNEAGNLVLVRGGSGYSEACLYDESVGIIRLDDDMNRVDVIALTNFAGLPAYDPGGLNVVSTPHWVSPTAFQVELYFDCLASGQNGIYQFDVDVRHASLIAVNSGGPDDNISPTFTNITFTPSPDAPQPYVGQAVFPLSTSRVFALISYINMRDGLIVRREWYQNGKLWVEREEVWDTLKYGTQGVLDDVSIFSEGGGFRVGTYELRLFINGVPQFEAFTDFELRSFVIQGDLTPTPAPTP